LPNPIVLVTLIACVATAAAIDIRTGRVPNRITMGAAVIGLGLAATGASGLTLTQAAIGTGLGFLLLLPGYLLGGTGAGDVKLLAGIGAIVGPDRIVTAFLFSAIAGGVIAIGFAVERGRVLATLSRTAAIMGWGSAAQVGVATGSNRFPFAPAIAIGTLLAVLADG